MALTPEQTKECETLKRLFLEKAGMTQKEFVRVNGLGTPANLGQYLQGRRALTVSSALKIAKGLGVKVGDFSPRLEKELDSYPMTPRTPSDNNVEPVQIKVKKIPIFGEVQCGPQTYQDVKSREKALADGDFVYVDANYRDECFALRLRGDSMTPTFSPGDEIIVDPCRSPNPGDFVVAQRLETCDCESTFKRYRLTKVDTFGRKQFELVPLNENYPTISSTSEPIRIVGVMIEHRRKY